MGARRHVEDVANAHGAEHEGMRGQAHGGHPGEQLRAELERQLREGGKLRCGVCRGVHGGLNLWQEAQRAHLQRLQ
eukprot:2740524-Alexandrium_andersonii.AAC.1